VKPARRQRGIEGRARTARRELDAERLRSAELASEVEALGREARRLRDDLTASKQKAAKRRERRPSADDDGIPRPASASAEAPAAEAPMVAPRAE
jgi:chromosome segregation ATPase